MAEDQPTVRLQRMIAPARIEMDLEDADAVADFLIFVAALVRERKRIVLTVE